MHAARACCATCVEDAGPERSAARRHPPRRAATDGVVHSAQTAVRVRPAAQNLGTSWGRTVHDRWVSCGLWDSSGQPPTGRRSVASPVGNEHCGTSTGRRTGSCRPGRAQVADPRGSDASTGRRDGRPGRDGTARTPAPPGGRPRGRPHQPARTAARGTRRRQNRRSGICPRPRTSGDGPMGARPVPGTSDAPDTTRRPGGPERAPGASACRPESSRR